MSLSHLIIFSAVTLLVPLLFKQKGKTWLLLVGSVIAVYWLQPATPIRNLDFWFPTATLALTVIVYLATQPPIERQRLKADIVTGTVIAILILAVSASRYLGSLCCLTPTRPPQTFSVIIAIAFFLVIGLVVALVFKSRVKWLNLLVLIIIGLFLVLKTESLGQVASGWLRGMKGQTRELANSADLSWLGFSYVAFRLIHTIRDRIAGKLPDVTLQEFVTYIIFFPTFTAGPIDRIQRFTSDLREEFVLRTPQLIKGMKRITIGVFKKFIVADSLALIALNPQNAAQSSSPLWTWVLLYAFSIRIYLDFSGYTDIAIGIGNFLGFNLPENFKWSYLQPNLTMFWSNWHMTLTNWFRAYFFNPMTRAMRASKHKIPMWVIIFFGQMGTMVLIGLWHGITWNFILWGVWHGAGLFLHNRWSNFFKSRISIENKSLNVQRVTKATGVLLTFNFVALGWVWFALPLPDQSLQVLGLLFGI